MGGVGDEVLLGFEGGLEAGEEVVEGVAQLFELLVGVVEGEPLMQVAGRDPPGGGGDGPDRAQHPAGDEPAEQHGEHGDDGQGDREVDQKVVLVGEALGRRGRPSDATGGSQLP